MAPTRKMSAAALGGAFAIITVWLVNVFLTNDIPSNVEIAIAVVFTWLCGYFTNENTTE